MKESDVGRVYVLMKELRHLMSTRHFILRCDASQGFECYIKIRDVKNWNKPKAKFDFLQETFSRETFQNGFLDLLDQMITRLRLELESLEVEFDEPDQPGFFVQNSLPTKAINDAIDEHVKRGNKGAKNEN